MSNIKVSKEYNGKKGGTIYRGNTKATIYHVNGKEMLSEELHEYILEIIGDNTISARDLETKLKIGVKKVSTALAKMYHDGSVQNKIIDGRMHYFKTDRCMLQEILHPRPKFKELSRATYTEKYFIKRLNPDALKNKTRRKKGDPKNEYKKYGD